MAGILYIVATPIGNLDDMPPRVAATFGAADFIAAEDTRVTMRLLNYLGLKKPMVSYYEHALQKGEGILRRIEAGENCALCSDAGMPCVSDPGEVIVRDALARGIKVVPVPAASACVTALAVSGQDTSRWVFEGFLPVNRKQKKERLAELLGEKRTVIFYEAPHKLRTTLDDLVNAFGPERSITLCRELTKLHEQVLRTTLGEATDYFVQTHPRGGPAPLRRQRAEGRVCSVHGWCASFHRAGSRTDPRAGRTARPRADRTGLRPHCRRQGRSPGDALLQE